MRKFSSIEEVIWLRFLHNSEEDKRMSDLIPEKLMKYQTDHLFLLIGTNPLPNYVAAKLLCPTGKVHLLCSRETQEVAQRVKDRLGDFAVVRPILEECEPSQIYQKISEIIREIPDDQTIGLHYTGGTKAMAVHAHRAAQAVGREVWCSYLDARKLRLIVDGGMPDGRDDFIAVGRSVILTVPDMAKLHNISFKKYRSWPHLLEVSRKIHEDFESVGEWHKWAEENLKKTDDSGKIRVINPTEIRNTPAPCEKFPDIGRIFSDIGALQGCHLDGWAAAAGYLQNKEGLKDFVEWLSGGYWLESIVLQVLKDIQEPCHLDDCGMGYKADQSKFEFDVAATRGYQLFAISCTTDSSTELCKSKLFEAYTRAKQIGGEEARIALVSYHPDTQMLLSRFKSENYFAEGSVVVFGKSHIAKLRECLQLWIDRV